MWLLKETQDVLILRTKNWRGMQGLWGCLFFLQKNTLGRGVISFYWSPTSSRHCPRHLSWSWKRLSDLCEENDWSRPQLLHCEIYHCLLWRSCFPWAASNQLIMVGYWGGSISGRWGTPLVGDFGSRTFLELCYNLRLFHPCLLPSLSPSQESYMRYILMALPTTLPSLLTHFL